MDIDIPQQSSQKTVRKTIISTKMLFSTLCIVYLSQEAQKGQKIFYRCLKGNKTFLRLFGHMCSLHVHTLVALFVS